MEIFKWLDDKSFVSSFKINDFRQTDVSYYLNVEVQFVDQSVLYAREFVEPSKRKYAFHWQTIDGALISRWDNAPHFPNLLTHPHHRHTAGGEVENSYDISFEDILKSIRARLTT
jgi:hypothetical protein